MTSRAPKKRTEPLPPDLDEDSLTPSPLVDDGEIDVYQGIVSGEHSGHEGSAEITGSLLQGANLSGTRLEPVSITHSAIRKGDLSNAVWVSASIRRTAITGCRAVGWRLFLDLAEDLLVEDCRWELGSVHVTRSKGPVVFRNCTFEGTAIRGDLSSVIFDGCTLAGAEFGADRATGTDLRTSRLAGARGLGTLRGALITAAQAVELAGVLAAELGFDVE
ncbi:MAG: hypothetical protein JWO79_1333 [Actinomycetia bacterium]|jgi:uncharacterized protein YjbI with pentapeptide repeats|nr:hypothetical protein [Actinomycetes bacterium]